MEMRFTLQWNSIQRSSAIHNAMKRNAILFYFSLGEAIGRVTMMNVICVDVSVVLMSAA